MSRHFATSPTPWAMRYQHTVFSESIGRSTLRRLDPPAPQSTAAASDQITEDEEAFLRFIFIEAGLPLSSYRPGTLRRRLHACLRALRATSFSHARRILQTQPAMLGVAVSALIIGVTSFFRDMPVFDDLRDSVLPEMIRGRHGLAAWCAACSDGAEVYSLGMVLGEMSVLDRCLLLGTDCRPDAIARARQGLYDATAVRGVPGRLLERYFQADGAMFRVRPELSAQTHWRRADVLALQEPGAWDIIFCRNMAMYLTADAAHRLWYRLEAALRPGGVLVLGRAERPNGARHLSMVAPCIFRRNRG